MTRLGWKCRAENVFGSLISPRLRKGKQSLLHMWYLLCYSCYKPGDKSLMRKGLDSDCDK
jgi:hypothetical protein